MIRSIFCMCAINLRFLTRFHYLVLMRIWIGSEFLGFMCLGRRFISYIFILCIVRYAWLSTRYFEFMSLNQRFFNLFILARLCPFCWWWVKISILNLIGVYVHPHKFCITASYRSDHVCGCCLQYWFNYYCRFTLNCLWDLVYNRFDLVG